MKDKIDAIFKKYVKVVWVNPYTPKAFIPSENIPSLKKEILELCTQELKTK